MDEILLLLMFETNCDSFVLADEGGTTASG